MASGVKAPLPKSRVTISLEKIMAPMVAGITNKLITEIASEMEDFKPLMLFSNVLLLGCVSDLWVVFKCFAPYNGGFMVQIYCILFWVGTLVDSSPHCHPDN